MSFPFSHSTDVMQMVPMIPEQAPYYAARDEPSDVLSPPPTHNPSLNEEIQ